MRDERCGNCRFWNQDDSGTSVGTCHRYPPTVYGEHETVVLQALPVSGASFWCGEFEPAEEERPDETLDGDGQEPDDDAL